MNILYEDNALVVLDKACGAVQRGGHDRRPAAALGQPQAYVGVVHRLDTGVSRPDGLCPHPGRPPRP